MGIFDCVFGEKGNVELREDRISTDTSVVQGMDSIPKPFDHFWRCVECGTSVKHFLGICWKCGAVRPGGEVARQASLESERAILAQAWTVREDAVKDLPQEFVERYKRDIERHLRRIDLARSIILTTTNQVAGSRLVSRLESIVVTGQESRSAVVLGDYYQEGYHGELHHADYGELVVFMLMYKAHKLGANAVLNVAITPSPLNDSYGHVVSGDAAVMEDVMS